MNNQSFKYLTLSVMLTMPAILCGQIRYDADGLTIGDSRPADADSMVVVSGMNGMDWQASNGGLFKFDLVSLSSPSIASINSVVDFFAPTGPGVFIDIACQEILLPYTARTVSLHPIEDLKAVLYLCKVDMNSMPLNWS